MPLTRDILDRVDRVYEYHAGSKHTYESVRQGSPELDWANQPNPYRTFVNFPKVALPTTLHGIGVPALELLTQGRAALPESQQTAQQTLQTLATWLFTANGLTRQKRAANATWWLRSCPSSGALYPYEIYVAAFAVSDLEPGLYHYSPREFSLRRLREGLETLSFIQRGQSDLGMLREVPAAFIVTTNFWRSAWKYQKRAYRYVLQDAGHLIENLVKAGTALGAETQTRLWLNDQTMRELIGVSDDASFGEMEVAQALVVWSDKAAEPMYLPPQGLPPVDPEQMLPLVREPLSEQVVAYGSIIAAHADCTAPDELPREVSSPLTELSPIPPTLAPTAMPAGFEPDQSEAFGKILLHRRSARDFAPVPMPRDHFLLINRLAFRTGTYDPIRPAGPHVGIVRPFWVINDVAGVDSGVWYYDPMADQWFQLARQQFRTDARFLSLEQDLCGNASAICFMMANLHALMTNIGPDTYRLAHLEAGVAGQRMYLSTNALGLGASGIGAFYDDDVRKFLGLERTGWEPIYEIALGIPEADEPHVQVEEPTEHPLDWRG